MCYVYTKEIIFFFNGNTRAKNRKTFCCIFSTSTHLLNMQKLRKTMKNWFCFKSGKKYEKWIEKRHLFTNILKSVPLWRSSRKLLRSTFGTTTKHCFTFLLFFAFVTRLFMVLFRGFFQLCTLVTNCCLNWFKQFDCIMVSNEHKIP